MRRNFKLTTLILLGAVSTLLLAIASTAFSIYSYGNSYGNTIKADAAIVLGAAVWGEEPSVVFRERINHAIHLDRKGDILSLFLLAELVKAMNPPQP
ncbi:MAG: hypothetical protein ACHBN1_15105 [Heteroscytonema crispum UTEX LB 1556]